MITRHKDKALLGVGAWFAVALAFGLLLALSKIKHETLDNLLGSRVLLGLVLTGLAVQYLVFFWGGSHLAKAKGYSNAMLLFGLFWPAQLIVLAVLLFALPDQRMRSSSETRKQNRSPEESRSARLLRYRRNARVANGLGVTGVLLALAFVLLPPGRFHSRDNACLIGVGTFLPSYAAIIYGCWWRGKAKGWHEAVVVIGLMPLAPLVVPYVRMIYLLPPVLPVLMVLLPLLLLGLVAALPDKSSRPKRKQLDED